MKTSESVRIITDLDNFKARTDEISSTTSYETVKHAISEIKKALYKNPNIPALCAPQLGIDLRLFVVRQAKQENDRFKVFLNPLIVTAEGLHLSREVCASIPDKEFIIPRRNKIHVAYQEEMGQVNSESYIETYAEVIQQMIELLDGITLADYGLDLDDVGGAKAFDKASKKQQTEVLALYLDSVKSFSAELEQEIAEDPELSKINDVINKLTEALKDDFKDSKESKE